MPHYKVTIPATATEQSRSWLIQAPHGLRAEEQVASVLSGNRGYITPEAEQRMEGTITEEQDGPGSREWFEMWSIVVPGSQGALYYAATAKFKTEYVKDGPNHDGVFVRVVPESVQPLDIRAEHSVKTPEAEAMHSLLVQCATNGTLLWKLHRHGGGYLEAITTP